jgi:hypothetical protein
MIIRIIRVSRYDSSCSWVLKLPLITKHDLADLISLIWFHLIFKDYRRRNKLKYNIFWPFDFLDELATSTHSPSISRLNPQSGTFSDQWSGLLPYWRAQRLWEEHMLAEFGLGLWRSNQFTPCVAELNLFLWVLWRQILAQLLSYELSQLKRVWISPSGGWGVREVGGFKFTHFQSFETLWGLLGLIFRLELGIRRVHPFLCLWWGSSQFETVPVAAVPAGPKYFDVEPPLQFVPWMQS